MMILGLKGLSGHLPAPGGWPLNGGSTVLTI